ncbi:MAG: DUF3301 domain-containing protein [Pseudomonadota bacterium]
MPTFEILSLTALAALAWLWYDSIQVRGIGIAAAKAACAAEGLQLLDDTVAIASLRLARDDDGRLLLRRVYGFDFSDTGNNRRSGSVVMLGQQVLIVNVGLRLVASNPTLH